MAEGLKVYYVLSWCPGYAGEEEVALFSTEEKAQAMVLANAYEELEAHATSEDMAHFRRLHEEDSFDEALAFFNEWSNEQEVMTLELHLGWEHVQ